MDATELLTDYIENNSVAYMLRKMYIYKQVSYNKFTCESSVYVYLSTNKLI